MKSLQYNFQVSQEAWDLLVLLGHGQAEYRDAEYSTVSDFQKSDVLFLNGTRDVEWFNRRNHNGTLYLMDELANHDLVELVEDSWHLTYQTSPLGKLITSQNV